LKRWEFSLNDKTLPPLPREGFAVPFQHEFCFLFGQGMLLIPRMNEDKSKIEIFDSQNFMLHEQDLLIPFGKKAREI